MEGIGHIISDVMKEVSRRADLRPRLEAERGCSLSDEEFLELAKRTGLTI